MLTDHYDNPLSTTSQAARDHYDQGVHLFLGGHYAAAEAFENAIAADPQFALGHAALARALMMSGNMAGAKASIQHAATLTTGISSREIAHVEILGLLLSGKPVQARTAVWSHVTDHPRDALVAQLCSNVFGLIGFSGKVGREAELLAYTTMLLPHYGDDWWMMSMQALSLCETGQTDASLALMEKSLQINPRNANASHFKSHAQYEAGETNAGRRYLTDWLADYDDRSVLFGHLNWHAALWALEQGDEAAMWHTIDCHVGPGGAKGLPINVLTDTAAILHRAQLAGVTVDPQRWKTLSDYAATYFPETGQSFADIHAALSHAMAGEGARLAHIAETAKGYAGDLVKPVATAWRHIVDGNWQEALSDLTPVMAETERLGGSRAQRDLLELTYANVLLMLGKTDEASRSLRTRRAVLAKVPQMSADR
ncbi:tetratricopeptide repeat protein [Shimia haliotis]|uniref:Tetratricopeptide repeat protein 38 n=1 Tax=Shimia haliotis TaxID=1280847 RepID=A0A1I4GNS4_9RHOB|nr:tetratricopeptide repeat protein [Shimia haliotis]SFL31722.1 Tfp pilus assembly protein PilF [Shimia haliotis]